MKLRKFTKIKFLQQLGRPLLATLLERFESEFAAQQVTLPPATLDDSAYLEAVSKLALAPQGLPGGFIEALYIVEELGTGQGVERLERAMAASGIALHVGSESTPAEIVLQFWLALPEFVVRHHQQQRLSRLSAFEYFGSVHGTKAKRLAGEPARPLNFEPTAETTKLLTQDFDEWFAAHHRGEETARIRVRLMANECWFLVTHGHTFARTAKVDGRRTEMLHYRPAREDVVVYTPERDEIRSHAGTKAEREMYRRTFGRRLFADANYFSEKKAYTLQPLIDDGADSLEVDPGSEIRRIVLREVVVAWDEKGQELTIRRSNDVFGAPVARGCEMERIPKGGQLIRAVFDVYFGNEFRPRKVQIRPPNVLKVGRHCDAQALQEWLSRRGFRTTVAPETSHKVQTSTNVA